LKLLSPAERLAAQQRDHEKLQRERQLRELTEEARGLPGNGRGCDEESRRAPMHAASKTSLLLSRPLQALPLVHPHRVSKAGKWAREGPFSD